MPPIVRTAAAALLHDLRFGPEPLPGGNVSTLVAYDPVKQGIQGRAPVGNSRFGGTLSTASNLVFQVAPDGRLMAYSAENGGQLLELPRKAFKTCPRNALFDTSFNASRRLLS